MKTESFWIGGTILALILFTMSLRGAETGENIEVLTLEKALALANKRNLSLQASRRSREEARGRIVEARSEALPHLNLSTEYVRLDDVATIGMGGRSVTWGQQDNYEAKAQLEQVLYSGGGVSSAIDLASSYADSVESGIARSANVTAFRVHEAFNRVLLAREDCEVAREAIEMAERNLSDVQSLHRQGLAKRFDKLRAESQVSRAEANLLAAQNESRKAKFVLMRMLDLPFDPLPRIEGSLDPEGEKVSTTNLIETALSNRRDYAAANDAVEMRDHSLDVARSKQRPTLVVFGNAKRSNPDRSYEDEWENSWEVGARVDWPLFDGFATRGKVMQARSNQQRTEIERDDLASQIGLEVSNARADLQTAKEIVESRQRNVEQAEESLRLARHAYKEGLQAQIDVITAQVALTESRREYQAALYTHSMALRKLEFATGELETGTENEEIE